MTKPKPIRCLRCETIMGELKEKGTDRYHCQECNTTWDTVGGKLVEATEKGDEVVIATVQDAEEVPEDKPHTYDVYFTSKDKRRFQGIVDTEHMQGALVLTSRQGKEILLNWANVNMVEEV